MDSITQIVLGAAVGEATLGHKIGRKAGLYGGILGTLPDLDVLLVKNAVDSFTEHRSFSHSLIVLLLVSPLFAWLIKRLHPVSLNQQANTLKYFIFAVYAIFATHALLDAFTVYGTQLLWPLTNYPFGLGSIFIVDPLYTLPFLACLLVTIITRKRLPVFIGIALSCSYLAWTLFAQHQQSERFEASFIAQDIKPAKTITLPMPLNTLLWKNIAMVEGGYIVSFSSVLDKASDSKALKSIFIASDEALLNSLNNHPPVQKLQYFTKGFYQVKESDNEVWLSDLRMGGFGNFVFNFNVGAVSESGIQPIPADNIGNTEFRPEGAEAKRSLGLMWQRIFDQDIDLFQLFKKKETVNTINSTSSINKG